MMVLRRLSPGGYEYLTASVACADHVLQQGDFGADHVLDLGYPPGEWFGSGAAELEVSGSVTTEQMNALFGEGRHPNANAIEAEMLADGASVAEALRATKLGRRFPQYRALDDLRHQILTAYHEYNRARNRPDTAPISEPVRHAIQHRVYAERFTQDMGHAPRDERELAGWLAEQKRQLKNPVAGYEAVFAPPKSVSAAWALGDADTRQRLLTIHRQAVRDALTFLENHAVLTRQGSNGEAQVDTMGITAALFEHYESRAGDPHLHTHVPISAKVKRATDGAWTTVDSRTLHAATVTVSEYYNSRIRDLTREHGAVWRRRPQHGFDLRRPVWELDAVPDELLAAFARRAQQVEQDRARRVVAFRDQHQREPSPRELCELSRRAQYATRATKTTVTSLAQRRAQWRALAVEKVGQHVLTELDHGVFTQQPPRANEVDVAALARVVRNQVSDYHAHFTRWNLEAEAHRQTANLPLAAHNRQACVTAIVHRILFAPDTLTLRGPAPVTEPATLRRSDGESVFSTHHAQRYTTERTLLEEAALIRWARTTGGHRIARDLLQQALSRTSLNTGQRHLVSSFATSGRLLQLSLAPAGTGKTTAMRTLADAWRTAGGRVFAFGPSAGTARRLGQALHVPGHTLHAVTTALGHGIAERKFGFSRGDMLLIDEAAQAGTHTLHTVVQHAVNQGAVVRLLGDDKQLGAVEAGGAIRLIAHDVGAVRIDEVVRFADPAQAEASLRLREGDPAGLDYYFQRDRVTAGSRETMRDAAHRAWCTDLQHKRETLLVVPINEDVVTLNHEARARRLQVGHVASDAAVALHDGTYASVGDWIVTRRNNRRLPVFGGIDWVKNGDTWHVLAVHADGSLQVAHRAHNGQTRLPADYVTTHVELAYAATINRVHGMTSHGNAHHLVTPQHTREQLYTTVTRARHGNFLYVVTHHHVADEHRHTPPETTARSVLHGVLQHSEPDTAATEILRTNLAHDASLAAITTRHTFLAQYGSETRYEQLLTEQAPATLDQNATPALLRTLHHAEDRGWQAERLLPQLLAHRPLNDEPDPAETLRKLINHHVTTRTPPARVVEPDPAQIDRWQQLVTTIAPEAPVTDTTWHLVWRHAAAAAADGHHADAALARATHLLAQQPSDPTEAHRVVAHQLVAELATQHANGAGWHPALPWMARPHPEVLAHHPDLTDTLHALNTAAKTRLTELRHQVATEQPTWTTGLGPRPDNPQLARRWDHLASLAAAYRDTHHITTTDPNQPLGPPPTDPTSLDAHAWRTLTKKWSPVMHNPTTPPTTDELIAALNDTIAEHHTAAHDDTLTHHTNYDDDLANSHDTGHHASMGY